VAPSGEKTAGNTERTVVTNRRALRNYHVLERIEAGIELTGTEVKSIRAGRVSLDESFARVEKGQVILYNMHVSPYSHGGAYNHEPRRRRRLLLHRAEIHRLFGRVALRGLTLVPLRVYLRRGWVKVELGVCRGKHLHDRREDLRRRTLNRELAREVGRRRRG